MMMAAYQPARNHHQNRPNRAVAVAAAAETLAAVDVVAVAVAANCLDATHTARCVTRNPPTTSAMD